jgi:hypothetical protein
MRPLLWRLLFASTFAILSAGPAQAIICFTIYDKDNNAIYQDTHTPIDLSEKGLPAWEALNQRGEHLSWSDAPKCPTIVFLTGTGGSPAISVDEMVAGLPVRTVSGNAAKAAAVSNAAGIAPGAPTPSGFRSPVPSKSGSGGY